MLYIKKIKIKKKKRNLDNCVIDCAQARTAQRDREREHRAGAGRTHEDHVFSQSQSSF